MSVAHQHLFELRPPLTPSYRRIQCVGELIRRRFRKDGGHRSGLLGKLPQIERDFRREVVRDPLAEIVNERARHPARQELLKRGIEKERDAQMAQGLTGGVARVGDALVEVSQ